MPEAAAAIAEQHADLDLSALALREQGTGPSAAELEKLKQQRIRETKERLQKRRKLQNQARRKGLTGRKGLAHMAQAAMGGDTDLQEMLMGHSQSDIAQALGLSPAQAAATGSGGHKAAL